MFSAFKQFFSKLKSLFFTFYSFIIILGLFSFSYSYSSPRKIIKTSPRAIYVNPSKNINFQIISSDDFEEEKAFLKDKLSLYSYKFTFDKISQEDEKNIFIFLNEDSSLEKDFLSIKIKANKITINAQKKEAMRSVCALFMQKYFGYYSLAPNFEIFEKNSAKFENENFYFKPSYVSRQIYAGILSKSTIEHLKNNFYLPLFKFSHTSIFDESAFEENPEYFALIDGKRKISHQADFANENAVNFASKKAIEYFNEYPNELSFALGIKDNELFSLANQNFKTPYFRSYPNYSNSVFSFVNKVAKNIKNNYSKHRYIGTLAYLYTQKAPPFKMEENVIVYIASDKANMYNKQFQEEELKLYQYWKNTGIEYLGTYSYEYSYPYFMPAISHKLINFYLENLHKKGSNGLFTEMGFVWGFDAFKTFLLLQKAFDINKSYAELEDIFFSNYYGNSASKMKEFFKKCEEIWSKAFEEPRWLKYYKKHSHIELFTPQICKELSLILRKAFDNASTYTEIKNVKQTMLAFDISSSYSNYYFAQKELSILNITNENQAYAKELYKKIIYYQGKLQKSIKKLEEHSLYKNSAIKFDETIYNDNASLLLSEIENLDNLDDIFTKEQIQLTKEPFTKQILKNPDFSYANSQNNPWKFFHYNSDNFTAKIDEKENIAYFKNCEYGAFVQWFRAKQDQVFKLEFEFLSDIKPGAICYILLTFNDENGKILSKKYYFIPAHKFDKFAKKTILAKAPENTKKAAIGIHCRYMSKDDFVKLKYIKLWTN